MNVVIAQGSGYYGSAFFTTELSLDTIKSRLEGAGIPCDEQIGAWGDMTPEGRAERQLVMGFPPDCGVHIRPWGTPGAQPQPEPVVIFCTGHSKLDMECLRKVKTALDGR